MHASSSRRRNAGIGDLRQRGLFSLGAGIDSETGRNRLGGNTDIKLAGFAVTALASTATDALMHAAILSYSRSRGIFAGVNLKGVVVRPAEVAAVLKSIARAVGGQIKAGYFGMLTQGFPQLVRVNADVGRPDPSRSFSERSPVICQVRMVNETPLIPDLQRLEQMIAEETSVMQ